jgi:hypothetical protein
MEWMLKSDIILERAPRQARNVVGGSWILQEDDDNKTPVLEDDSEWDLDDEKVVDIEEWLKVNGAPVYEFLGFHPYKEIVLLRSHVSVVAYHLNTSKARDLGHIGQWSSDIQASFPYMPCWMGPLPGHRV